MALILRGKSKCSLCDAVLEEEQEVVSFPPFVGNQLDPLWFFSDAAFHSDCFRDHPLSSEACARYDEIRSNTSPDNRSCVVCKAQIEHADEYFTLGHLVSDARDPLHRYNYTQSHISCLPGWSKLVDVYKLILELQKSGRWKGLSLDLILNRLGRAMNGGVVTKLEFSASVAAICKRPRMYTTHGSLAEVIAYLDGLGKGIGVQPGSHCGVSNFFTWLARKLGKDEDTKWDELLLTFGDEEAALEAFSRLYREYAELEAAAVAEKAS